MGISHPVLPRFGATEKASVLLALDAFEDAVWHQSSRPQIVIVEDHRSSRNLAPLGPRWLQPDHSFRRGPASFDPTVSPPSRPQRGVDADAAVARNVTWPRGHLRRAVALRRLGRPLEATRALVAPRGRIGPLQASLPKSREASSPDRRRWPKLDG